jgi:3-dehydroquinate synthase
VHLIHIPTTLLAQVDASIGGKTAINHSQGKNMIGSFYQPRMVLIDLNTLNSLPTREFNAGLAEIIKYGLLAGGDFLETLKQSLKEGLTAQSSKLPLLIEQCCQIKAHYVELDEKENGLRALLNLGHTFAHALEAYTHYQHWLHGEAVAVGLYCAAILSSKLKLIDASIIEEVKQLLVYARLPYQIPSNINLNKLQDMMRLDKKIKEDSLRFIVIKAPGDCCLYDRVTEACLYDTLTAAVEGDRNE